MLDGLRGIFLFVYSFSVSIDEWPLLLEWDWEGYQLCSYYGSCGCYNKWLKTLCLKTTEMYSPTLLEARSLNSAMIGLKSRCYQGRTPCEGSKEEPSPASSSFWWLTAFLGLWLHLSNLLGKCLQISALPLHCLFLFVSNLPLFSFYEETRDCI